MGRDTLQLTLIIFQVDGPVRPDDVVTDVTEDTTECRHSNGSHSDVGYASMSGEPGVIDNDAATTNTEHSDDITGDRTKTLERTRSYSIVKPPPVDSDKSVDTNEDIPEEGDDTIVAEDNSDRKNIKEDKPRSPGKTAARTLFRQESQESQLSEKVRGYIEGDTSDTRGYNEGDNSEVSASSESLEILEMMPDSPDKTVTKRLPTLMETSSIETSEAGATLERSGSRANLEITPVTLNDPLGALSSQTTPMTTPAKDKAVS